MKKMRVNEDFRQKIIDFRDRISEEFYEMTLDDKKFARYIAVLLLEQLEQLEREGK